MKFFARFAMIILMLAFAIAYGVVAIQALYYGDASYLWDFMDQSETLPVPPVWAMIVALDVALGAMIVLGIAFWSIHRILQDDVRRDFQSTALHLRRCAQALLGFWLGMFLLTAPVPALLLWDVPKAQWPELEWIAVDLEIVFLVLAVALLAVSRELERAHDIEDENKQFL